MNRLLLILCLVIPAAAMAQRGPGTAPSRAPGWAPRKSYLDAQTVKLTPAEMATTVNRLKEIERILLQIPELATPEGFYITPAFYGGGDRQSTGNAIQSAYTLFFSLEEARKAVTASRSSSTTGSAASRELPTATRAA
jgi:hypothetical protein